REPALAPPPPRVTPSPRSFRFSTRRRGDDVVHIGDNVTVGEGEIVAGDAIAIGGSTHVFGEVRGDAVAVGGDVELGPRASVTGDVVIVGGTLRRDPAAQIGGGVRRVGWGSVPSADWWRRAWSGSPASAWLSGTFLL